MESFGVQSTVDDLNKKTVIKYLQTGKMHDFSYMFGSKRGKEKISHSMAARCEVFVLLCSVFIWFVIIYMKKKSLSD